MTMTDNDDPAPPRDPPPSDGPGKEEVRRENERATENRFIRSIKSGGTGVHVAPTDPEVPSAKRRGAIRRQRSLVGLSAVIMGLLSITLVLLYRASVRVGAREDDAAARGPHDTRSDIAPSADVLHENPSTGRAPPGEKGELGDDAPASIDNAPAGSASSFPKGPAPALDIIRTPAF
jgi:hypothetical protein